MPSVVQPWTPAPPLPSKESYKFERAGAALKIGQAAVYTSALTLSLAMSASQAGFGAENIRGSGEGFVNDDHQCLQSRFSVFLAPKFLHPHKMAEFNQPRSALGYLDRQALSPPGILPS